MPDLRFANLIFLQFTFLLITTIPFSSLQAQSSPPRERSVGGKSAPRLENAWEKVPEWLDDLPFKSELEAKFAIPDQQNRESCYLEAMLEFDFTGYRYFPELRKLKDQELQTRLAESRKRNSEANNFLFDELMDESKRVTVQPDQVTRISELVAPYVLGFSKLTEASKRKSCFFHSDFSFDSNHTHSLTASDVVFILSLRCCQNLSSPNAIQSLGLALMLSRDLVSFGMNHDQISSDSVDRASLELMATSILEQPKLTRAQLDPLIQLLKTHAEERSKTDIAVQLAMAENLHFRSLFRCLESEKYLTKKRLQEHEIRVDDSPVPLLLRQLVDYYFYRLNENEIKGEMDEHADTNKAVSEMWQKIKDDPDADFRIGARMMAGLFMHTSLNNIKPGHFDADIAVLNQRYAQIVEASQLPFPKSTERLKPLEESWAVENDTMSKTKLLRWLLPKNRASSLRLATATRVNAFLCLAAIRKWKLENNAFVDLETATKAIGINSIPVDPYTGQPLKAIVNNHEIIVYSYGPDLDDDRAESEVGYQQPDGDIVYRLRLRH